MSDTREKLIELLRSADKKSSDEIGGFTFSFMADYLIANGVRLETKTSDKTSDEKTSEWIPVSERLPEESGLYITFGCTAVPVRWLSNFDKDIGKFGAWWNYEPDGKEHPRYRFIEAGNITHWMPLPEPPKGE